MNSLRRKTLSPDAVATEDTEYAEDEEEEDGEPSQVRADVGPSLLTD